MHRLVVAHETAFSPPLAGSKPGGFGTPSSVHEVPSHRSARDGAPRTLPTAVQSRRDRHATAARPPGSPLTPSVTQWFALQAAARLPP